MIKHIFLVSILATCLTSTGCSPLLTATTEGEIRLSPGKRTLGTMIDDQQLETIAIVNLNKAHPDLQGAHINVTSYNGVLLLTGQVSSSKLKKLASATVTKIRNVRQVYNELQVQGKTSVLSRTNDTWLTTKVKSRLMAAKNVDGGRVKVVTESGTIYLMGLLSQAEANRAAEIARSTNGVQKVVKAIEYIN